MAAARGRKSSDEKAAEAARHASIRACAFEANASLGAHSADGVIDIEKIASHLGAEIAYEDLDGAKARVVQIGDRARIIIAKKISGVGAIRFCIAHEVGHLMLKHYAQGDALGRAFKRQRTCSPLTSDGSEIERDACVFATECLMPAPLATPMCQVAPATFDPVRAISSAFATSLQASAMRFVELTSERCAVVYMQRGRVVWAKKSPGFSAWISNGQSVAPNSAAADYFEDNHLEASRVLPATTWFPREKHPEGATVHEHMTAIPEAAAAFSLLWLPKAD